MDSHKVMGRRIVAFFVDGIILTAINAAMYFPFAEKQADILAEATPGETVNAYVNVGDYSLTGGKAGLFFLATLLVTFLYWVVLVGRTGWSLGKLLVGVRVVRSDDGTTPPGMMKAFLRHLVWLADMFPYLIPGLTGFIVAMTNPRRRRVGDMAAGTEVVKASAVGRSAPAPAGGAAETTTFGGDAEDAAPPPAMGTQAMPAVAPSRPEPPPAPAPAAGPPADWYPDPHGEKRLRYWDGQSWTGHTAD